MLRSEIEPIYTLAENTGARAFGLSRNISTSMLLLNGDSPSSYKMITFNNATCQEINNAYLHCNHKQKSEVLNQWQDV